MGKVRALDEVKAVGSSEDVFSGKAYTRDPSARDSISPDRHR
jgi:hypothetical protein